MTRTPARRSTVRGSGPAPSTSVPRVPDASPRGLLALRGLLAGEIRGYLRRAVELESMEASACARLLAGRHVATLFFEDSTRTRTSFAIAAQRLGAHVVDLSVATSSVNKGETLVDTARNVEAMGVGALVVRARQSGSAALIAGALRVPVINAGDGRHEHPTQGLLDALTIARAHGRGDFDLSGLSVAYVGDLASSRVARSGIAALTTLGARIVGVGPPALAPDSIRALGCEVSRDLDAVIPGVDAVVMLRIQFERHDAGGGAPDTRKAAAIASVREYRTLYGLDASRASRLKPGAVVLHPGPINRGIEIDSDVADGPRSLILRQVSNGVLVRMAVLERWMR